MNGGQEGGGNAHLYILFTTQTLPGTSQCLFYTRLEPLLSQSLQEKRNKHREENNDLWRLLLEQCGRAYIRSVGVYIYLFGEGEGVQVTWPWSERDPQGQPYTNTQTVGKVHHPLSFPYPFVSSLHSTTNQKSKKRHSVSEQGEAMRVGE